MQVSDLAEWVRAVHDPTVAPMVKSLAGALDRLVHIGLGYISLSRETSTLSGGESQRVKMVRHLGSSLTDMTYIFDEPSIGLHAHDIRQFDELLLQLRDKGNTVLVVEHKPDVIAIADHVVDMGPGAGQDGGQVVYAGDLAGLVASGHAHRGAPRSPPASSRARPARPPVPCGSRAPRSTTCRTSRSRSRPAC